MRSIPLLIRSHMIRRLDEAVKASGGPRRFAQSAGLSADYVKDVLMLKRPPGRKLLAELSLESVEAYREKHGYVRRR